MKISKSRLVSISEAKLIQNAPVIRSRSNWRVSRFASSCTSRPQILDQIATPRHTQSCTSNLHDSKYYCNLISTHRVGSTCDTGWQSTRNIASVCLGRYRLTFDRVVVKVWSPICISAIYESTHRRIQRCVIRRKSKLLSIKLLSCRFVSAAYQHDLHYTCTCVICSFHSASCPFFVLWAKALILRRLFSLTVDHGCYRS